MRFAMGTATMALATLVTGCVIDGPGLGDPDTTGQPPGDGIVEVSWIVGSSGCALAQVTDIQLTIGTYENTYPCDNGSTRVQLPAGDYSLVATGLDADGVARFEATEELVSIFEDETTILPTLRLSALPASLTLFWRFENGSLCGANGVDSIDVALFDNEQLVDPFPIVVDCDPGEADFDDIAAGSYVVSLLGQDESGVAIFDARKEIELYRGETLAEELVLTALADDTGKP